MASEMVNALLAAEKSGALETASAAEKGEKMIADAKAKASEREEFLKNEANKAAREMISAALAERKKMQDEAA